MSVDHLARTLANLGLVVKRKPAFVLAATQESRGMLQGPTFLVHESDGTWNVRATQVTPQSEPIERSGLTLEELLDFVEEHTPMNDLAHLAELGFELKVFDDGRAVGAATISDKPEGFGTMQGPAFRLYPADDGTWSVHLVGVGHPPYPMPDGLTRTDALAIIADHAKWLQRFRALSVAARGSWWVVDVERLRGPDVEPYGMLEGEGAHWTIEAVEGARLVVRGKRAPAVGEELRRVLDAPLADDPNGAWNSLNTRR